MAAVEPEDCGLTKADLACERCKRKKSKCDRQIPTCSLCRQSAKQCSYPTVRLKPGPRLGSTNRRTRQRAYRVTAREATTHHPPPVYCPAQQHGPICLPTPVDCSAWSRKPEISPLSPQACPSKTSHPATRSPQMAAFNFAKAISLSSFFHPSHEASLNPPLRQRGRSQPGFLLILAGAKEKLTMACEVLHMSIFEAQAQVDVYFEVVAGLTCMSLFHQPSFQDKISGIEDPNHLIALFAAMFSISSRFSSTPNSTLPFHKDFHALSLKYINAAVDACSHSPPPLCLVQAMTLAGFYSVINGVYGQAWRLVGAAVRVAYELRLHMIDHEGLNEAPTNDNELTAWSLNEERRRCWWALWELDIFASTIKRAPTAIDWKMNETCLPVSDDVWFANKYQASCLLRGGPEERWRNLKLSGNEGAFAWSMLLAALMRDAQILCHDSLQGLFSNLDPKSDVPKLVQYFSHSYTRQAAEECSERLSTLVRAYQAMREELPAALAHGGGPLTFDLQEGEDPLAARRASAGKYNVGMMKASASFMIYQNHVVADMIEGLIPLPFSSPEVNAESSGPSTVMGDDDPTTRVGLQNFLEASDTVLRLLASCPADHVRYVNPYYASTVWIAATLQIFKRIFRWNEAPTLTESKYATLRQTYLRFAEFWGTPLTLLQNLDSLEARLEARQKEMEMSGPRPGSMTGIGRGPSPVGVDRLPREEERRGRVDSISPSQQSLPQPESVSYGQPPLCVPIRSDGRFGQGETGSLEWSSAVGVDVGPPTDDSPFSGGWSGSFPDDLFVDNFAWYSSDIMAALCHGYTG